MENRYNILFQVLRNLSRRLDVVAQTLRLLNEERTNEISWNIQQMRSFLVVVGEGVGVRIIMRHQYIANYCQKMMDILLRWILGILDDLNAEVDRQQNLPNINQAVINVLNWARNGLREMCQQHFRRRG